MTRRERVIVVGTGPAGAAAARILAYAGFEPLVLEAGSRGARLGLTVRLRGVTSAKWKPALQRRRDVSMIGDRSAELFEALAPGGLSNHWACAVPRFAPEDFVDAARSGEANRWPLDYPELVPWYERVECWLSVAGSSQDLPRLPAGEVSTHWELPSTGDALAPALSKTGRSLVAMPYAYGPRRGRGAGELQRRLSRAGPGREGSAQQIRGSCSPLSRSSGRSTPSCVRSVTKPRGSRRTLPMRAAAAPSG
jgi:choline dehydrogenase-like flavoprotein